MSVESPFWELIGEIADAHDTTIASIVEGIDASRTTSNLSSAIRTFVLAYVIQAYRVKSSR